MRILLLLCLLLAVPAVEAPPLALPGGDAHRSADVVLPGRSAAAGPAATAPVGATGQDPTLAVPAQPPGLSLTLGAGSGKEGLSNAVKLLILITVLAVAPGFLVMVTSFTRIVIVMGFVRKAIGTQTLPPNQVLLGLSLFLTLFVMAPTFTRINTEAVQPYLAGTLPEDQAMTKAADGLRDFMAKHTRKSDLALFVKISGAPRPRTIQDVPFTTLVPAFATSELKTAFQMGFIIFLPFLVIDLVVSAVLMALGMMMLPPVIVSLPFKILLFVLVDGWALLVQSLAASYA